MYSHYQPNFNRLKMTRALGVFVTDFDDTLSDGDTISTMFDAAAEASEASSVFSWLLHNSPN